MTECSFLKNYGINFMGKLEKDIELIHTESIVLCGCGKKLDDILIALKSVGAYKKIIAILDNNPTEYNVRGIKVDLLKNAPTYSDEAVFIVYNKYAGVIADNLYSFGIKNIHCIMDIGFNDYGYFLRKEVVPSNNYSIIRVGTEYGGDMVCNEILENIKNRELIIYSFGIGEDLSFSETMLKKYNSRVYAFDPTPKSIKYVENHLSHMSKKFTFYPYGLSDKNMLSRFFLPENTNYVSGSLEFHDGLKKESIEVVMKTLNNIMKEFGHNSIDLLKMDIEGSEFKVINQMLDTDSINITELCIDIHGRFFENGSDLVFKMYMDLQNRGFELVYVSDNFQEMTFINNNKINRL